MTNNARKSKNATTPLHVVKARSVTENFTASKGIHNEQPKSRTRKLDEALGAPRPKAESIVPGVVSANSSSFVRVAQGVDAQMYAVTMAASVAAGISLSPYGQTTQGPVMFAFGGANEDRVLEQCELLCAKLTNSATVARIKDQLTLHHFNLGAEGKGGLCDAPGLDQFQRGIPPQCKLIVFYDVSRCVRQGNVKEEDFAKLSALLRDLNQQSIATLVFYRAGKKSDVVFETEMFIDCIGYCLELTPDRGAPREYGTGFNVTRHKTSEHDTVPAQFQFWYTVINKKLQFGWECRDPNDKSSGKHVEIAERQKRVQTLSESGMQQKDIAAALGVNSATVSRDVSAIKSKAKKSSQKGTESGSSTD